jgi:ABC-2 type transport system permease protein
VQPALWLLIFGQVMERIRMVPTGGLRYIDFMLPGILAQSVLFIAIFYGIAIIWERDLGIVHKFLVSPTPRAALVLGKALSAGIRALAQSVIIYVLALLVHVKMNWNPLALAGVLAAVLLGAAIFSTFLLIIACLVKTRERFMGIGQLLTMPLFFASNAIYPIAMMPTWLQVISRINPLTYEVDALRALMLVHGTSTLVSIDVPRKRPRRCITPTTRKLRPVMRTLRPGTCASGTPGKSWSATSAPSTAEGRS